MFRKIRVGNEVMFEYDVISFVRFDFGWCIIVVEVISC